MLIDVIDAKKTGMILVDMQKEFVALVAGVETPVAGAVLARIAECLGICREAGINANDKEDVYR